MTKDEIRERLVELLVDSEMFNNADGKADTMCLADHLISRGVTIQRWIPVSERKPNLVPCGAGKTYSEAVNVLTSGRKVMTAVWDGVDFICPMSFWAAYGEEITHWTPVLLPLLESPLKEDVE